MTRDSKRALGIFIAIWMAVAPQAIAASEQAIPLPAPGSFVRAHGLQPQLGAPTQEQIRAESEQQRLVPASESLPVIGGVWSSQGPGPIQGGQSEGIPNNPVTGAVEALAVDPTNANVIWIGSVNGGIWKTNNATATPPTWTPETDGLSSLSIGAMNRDQTDATNQTLVAGVGRYSSFAGVGGPRDGVLRTTNGGSTWTQLASTGLQGANISGIIGRGSTIVASVDVADSYTCANIGIFYSINTGSTFTRVGNAGGAMDLAGDPNNNAVLYTAMRYGTSCIGTNGIYRSADTGATWTKVSSAAMDTLMADGSISNSRIAVGQSGQVYVGIIDQNGHLSGLFRSPDGMTSWTALDLPTTNEGGTLYGLQPNPDISGGQGAIHFSIVADPTNANIVYVGGDRQPGSGDPGGSFPNSLGANTYSGRLFRVNAAATPGTQATSLTHCQTATVACNGTASTLSNSAPHADSRRMVFDANGNIIEADDGGVFRRTSPSATGDWFSLNANQVVTESHDVAYDHISHMIFTGNQDVGTTEQTSVGGTTWQTASGGDGGDVSVDTTTLAGSSESIRYSAFAGFSALLRRIMNTSGAMVSYTYPALTLTTVGTFYGQFTTPVALNNVVPAQMLIAGENDLYESLDSGTTIAGLSFNKAAGSIVYGGKSSGVNNAALIYATCLDYTYATPSIPCTTTNGVWVRTSGTGAPVQTATSPGTTQVRAIAVDPNEWHNAYVINDAGEVWSTTTAGATWTNVTGNLSSGATDLRSIVVVPGTTTAVVVGTGSGVFRMPTSSAGTWSQLGSGIPSVPVYDLMYDTTDDVLVAGTLGRGAWKLTGVANPSTAPAPPTNVVASATSLTTVSVTWTAAAGATSYDVYRSTDHLTYTEIGTPTTSPFTDTVSSNTAYLYKVRSFNGAESSDSNLDIATTVQFTDDPITQNVTAVKALHFTELLAAVNLVRTLAALPSIAFTAPAPAGGIIVRAQHVIDLRTGLDAARSALALPAISYGESITAGTTMIKASHMTELRNGVK